jgi:hypothetical protein
MKKMKQCRRREKAATTPPSRSTLHLLLLLFILLTLLLTTVVDVCWPMQSLLLRQQPLPAIITVLWGRRPVSVFGSVKNNVVKNEKNNSKEKV